MTDGESKLTPYEAINLPLDRQLLVLDAEHYNAFLQTLEHPPAPGPRLKSLVLRTPTWWK